MVTVEIEKTERVSKETLPHTGDGFKGEDRKEGH